MKYVKFTKSPTGRFKLAYSVGQIGQVPDKLADQLIKEQFAVVPEETEKKTAIEADKRNTRKK